MKMSMNNQANSMLADFKKRFIISSLLTIPILILSPTIRSFFSYSLKFSGDRFILLFLATVIFLYGGKPFFIGTYREIKAKTLGMMTLVTLATTIAYFYSVLVTFGFGEKFFFWELATLIDVMLLGHYIEMRALKGASISVENLVKILPQMAHVVQKDGSIKDVLVGALKVSDNVLVKSGERVPADGQVIEGESEVSEAVLTGESLPRSVRVGDNVLAGAINNGNFIVLKIEKSGKNSYLSLVIDIVKKTIASKSESQTIADKAAFILTITALSFGTITFLTWIFFRPIYFALERAVTVMVITCPHALGLAVPLVISSIVIIAARYSILIRNKKAFENAYNIGVVVFDKTGTLTKGQIGVSDLIPLVSIEKKYLLAYAASLEVKGKHAIASAIVNKAKEDEVDLLTVDNFEQIIGKGVAGEIHNQKIVVGNEEILKQVKISVENQSNLDKAKKLRDEEASKGKVVVFVAGDNKIYGLIVLEDMIRDESKAACSILKDHGYKIAMITGDNKYTAKAVARELGIDEVLAEVLPDQKHAQIKKLQEQGYKVAMVGDGVNDAPALVQADLGIAIGAGTDVAIDSADIVLVKDDPRRVIDIFDLSKKTKRKLIENLIWALGYNIIALPLAAGVLYNYGIVLKPAMGAILMAASTIIVVINSKLFIKSKPNN